MEFILKMAYFIYLLMAGQLVESATDSDVRYLLEELFKTQEYNKLVRPVIDQNETVEVFVQYSLFGVSNVDEIEQKITTMGRPQFLWTDQFLTWDPSQYGGLKHLFLPQEKVWKPDISLKNGFKNFEELGSDIVKVLIEYDGSVFWDPFQVFESRCHLDITYFPFDEQTCHLDLIVWNFDVDEVVLYSGALGIKMEEAVISNGQWVVTSTSSTDEAYETDVRFTINLKRKPLYEVVNMIIPVILLCILNVFTFRIPTDTGERMGYTITVWLAFVVYLTVVSSSLPKSSDTVPVLAVYIIIQLVTGTITVLISAVESGIVCYQGERSNLTCIFPCVFKTCRSAKDPETKVSNKLKDQIANLDRVLFWTFFGIFIMNTCIVISVVANKYF